MDVERLTAELRKEFPQNPIIAIPEPFPRELIVEIHRTTTQSVAIAIIELSQPHVHHHLEEVYVVEDGELDLFINDQEPRHFVPGDVVKIFPNEIHWAHARPARVRVTCEPPWHQNDHHVIPPLELSDLTLFHLWDIFTNNLSRHLAQLADRRPSREEFLARLPTLRAVPAELEKRVRLWLYGWTVPPRNRPKHLRVSPGTLYLP